jgi:probable HAF family extracellular repeat protein
VTAPAFVQSFTFDLIDAPCSDCPGGIARTTSAQGINPDGVIVGFYVDAANKQHGFRWSEGKFTTIDVPGSLAGVSGPLQTTARGISPSGDIVGTYTVPPNNAPAGSPAFCPAADSPACVKGFLYRNGNFSTVLVDGHPGAIAQRISADGTIYGCVHNTDLMASMIGFVRTRSGDVTLLAGGGQLSDPKMEVRPSMNNSGTSNAQTIVGMDMTMGRNRGYIVREGKFQPYDVAGSSSTAIWDVNASGAFVGVYRTNRNHGFLQLPDGSAPITIDPPNSVNATALGINSAGSVVGQYTEAGGRLRGFLARPKQ